MIWALLITLLIKTINGPEEIFLIPKLKKEVKAHVTDTERKKKILLISKEAKKDIKTLDKLRKQNFKKIKKISLSKDVTSDQLMEIYMEYYNGRLDFQEQLIDRRIEVQNLLTEEEWNAIIKNAVSPSEKAKKKTDKHEAKEEKKVDELLEKINKVLENHISDDQKRKNIMDAVEVFSNTLKEYIEEGQQMNFEDSELIRQKHAEKEDLERYYQRHNELRLRGTKEYLKIREVARKNTNEKEWKALIKAMVKII